MTQRDAHPERAKFWRAPEYNNLELLHATFVTHRFVPHFHETYVVGVVVRGDYSFFHRGQIHDVHPGGIVLINPGEVHTGEPVDAIGWTYRTLYPAAALLGEIAAELHTHSAGLPLFTESVINDSALSQALVTMHAALEAATTRLYRDTLLRQTLGGLIQRYALQHSPLPAHDPAPRYLQRARDYLHAYSSQNIGLEELAAVAELSPYHLVRVFKQHTGLPPHQYLIQVRIAHAQTLLRQELAIAEVALQTGFSDQSHLTRWFKKIRGVSPGQYLRTG